MELRVDPVVGLDFAAVEKQRCVNTDVFQRSAANADLPSEFHGCCWNPLTSSLLVCDATQCCISFFTVEIYDRNELKLEESAVLGERGSSPGKFLHPVAVDVNTRGEIAVADSILNRIQVFSGNGNLVHHFGKTGSNRGEFRVVSDLKYTPLGHLAIVDTGNHRIQVLTPSGGLVLTVGRFGWSKGEFDSPCAITIARNGDVFICDKGNKRIQRLNAKGRFLCMWGSRRDTRTRAAIEETAASINEQQQDAANELGFEVTRLVSIFDSPNSIRVGANGEILVCDSGKNQILAFSDVGICLHILRPPNRRCPWTPVALCLCKNYLVIVSRSKRSCEGRPANKSDNVDPQEAVLSETYNHALVIYPPLERTPVGRFGSWPLRCAFQMLYFLTYEDAIQVRLVNRFFHRSCRTLRNQWRLFPLSPGMPSVKRAHQIISPATGLAVVMETFDKWGLRIFKPAKRIRKHVMDFESGFCNALSTLYGPMFCFQHEPLLRELFRFHAATSDREEINREAFVEIVTLIEEVHYGFLTWSQCAAFKQKSPESNVVVPSVRAAESMPAADPALGSLQLVETAQQQQLNKLLRKLQHL